MAATEEVNPSAGDQVELSLLDLLDLLEARLTKLVKIPKPKKSKKPPRKSAKRERVKADKGALRIDDGGVPAEGRAAQPVIGKRQALGKSLLQLRQKPQS